MPERRPKVLFVATLPPPVHGAAMMGKCIHDSSVVNGTFDADWVNLSTSRSLSDVSRFGLAKAFSVLAVYGRVLLRLLGHRYDCCYVTATCYGRGFLKDAPAVLFCKLFCRNVVLHHHNKGMSLYSGRPFYRWLMRLVYRGTRVMLLSEKLYDDVSAIVSREQVLTCPNGIDVPVSGQVRSDPAAPDFVFLSNLLASKGLIVLLDALSSLRAEGVACSCVIAGAESAEIDADCLSGEISSRGLDGTVAYAGPVYGMSKERLLSSGSVLVLPTMNDCQPLVVLEAMAHSMPVLTTCQGAVSDMVDDGVNGLMTAQGDPEDLAEKMKWMLGHPEERKRMGMRGRALYEGEFTEDAFIRRFCECIGKALER